MSDDLSAEDLAFLSARGISGEEIARQLRLLRAPRAHTTLDRPCTIGDGIERVADEERLGAAAAGAVAAGRVGTFVPASGAATRMFKDLLAYRGEPAAPPVRAFFDGLARFAFAPELARVLREDPGGLIVRGEQARLLDALLSERGLGYAELPKGLLPFHAGEDGRPVTAFEEHLLEAAELVRDGHGRCRLHLTVSPEHLDGFRRLLAALAEELEPRLAVRYDVSFSTQSPATDTVAVDATGALFRDDDGRPLLRPAGHGALLGNLEDAGGDVLLVKNIDNVAVARAKSPTYRWSRVLVGRLVTLQREIATLLERLERGDAHAGDDAERFAGEVLSRPGGGDPRAALERPLRVCGVVPNTGEPGGGPFWVRGPAGAVTRQIVESAEIDPAQMGIFVGATHFNPVFMACGMRDRHGRAYPLARFVDEDAVIITRKSAGDRELVALERPGLWNGGMAGWNTVFVEVPIDAFNPVKTVNDLLRDAHQSQLP